MDCLSFRRQHLEFLDGTLPGGLTVAVDAHRDGCSRCAAFDATLRRGLLVAWNLARIEPRPDFLDRLHAHIAVERPTLRLAAS